MKKNILVLSSLLTAALALSACGSASSDPAPTSSPVEPARTKSNAAASDEPSRSPRGNIIKTVGEPAGIYVDENKDEWALNFTVTDIEVDPVCTSIHATPGENGHLVAISIEATTAPEPGFTEVMLGNVSFSAHSWKVIASNGTTANTVVSNAVVNCLNPAEMMPSNIGAAEKVTGRILLDVPDSTGTLVYSSNGLDGWEWEYGTK